MSEMTVGVISFFVIASIMLGAYEYFYFKNKKKVQSN